MAPRCKWPPATSCLSKTTPLAHLALPAALTAWLLTAHPQGKDFEVPLPSCANPLCTAIPNLAFFQVVAATVAEATKSWDVHPFLAAHEGELGSKAAGYDEAQAKLEQRASTL